MKHAFRTIHFLDAYCERCGVLATRFNIKAKDCTPTTPPPDLAAMKHALKIKGGMRHVS